ncbi:Hypothetical protein, putative [Bodo saltans]|uniref:Uncharacterized protein n=1 Tax=Bodo saltans TaxID=75058 RepID=A0A0S4IX54_BODSA|nr:Hypothetical protein, putative [Bodo saltans]CUG06270.1 Hypothetical protein, putative [Bodo saltans]|eukprot:CUG06263.1 Hypothetical protein, putative [Bodo saltans]
MQLLPANACLDDGLLRTHLVLKTLDHRRYTCPRDIMQGSLLIRELLEDEDDVMSDAPQTVEIPLPAVDSKSLSSVFEYLEHHLGDTRYRDIERPLRGDLSALVEPWDWKYICDTLLQGVYEKGVHNLFAVLNAANYLHIPPLRDLCGAALANLVRNKSEEEILHIFGITEPFTKDQEEELCKEFPWLRE